MVTKNIYIIRIIASLFLLQHSLQAMRLANVAAVRGRYKNPSTIHFSTKGLVRQNRRNQRSFTTKVAQQVMHRHKSKQVIEQSVVRNQIAEKPAEKSIDIKNEKKINEQVRQHQVKDVIEKEKKPDVSSDVSSDNLVKQNPKNEQSVIKKRLDEHKTYSNKFLNEQDTSIVKNKSNDYDPYAHVKPNTSFKNNTYQTKVKQVAYNQPHTSSNVDAKEAITDLYTKRLKEFNESKKAYINQKDQVKQIENINAPTDGVALNKKNDDAPIVGNNKAKQNTSEPFQFGQLYAKGVDKVGNLFNHSENESVKNNIVDKKNPISSNPVDNSKPVQVPNEMQVSEMFVDGSAGISNGLNAIWNYGKNSVKNAWNKCTSYDFWLKPYEMFSEKVINKDPKTSEEVEQVKGNVHALLIKQFGNTGSTDAIYYLLRTGMVILGMALFCKPSLIAETGTGKVSVQLLSGIMQLVTGGSLASVVGMITGGVFKGLPAAIGFSKSSAQPIDSLAPKTTWGQWAFEWAKNIGTTTFLNQLWSYKFRKQAPLKNNEKQSPVLPNEQQFIQVTENTNQIKVNKVPEKELNEGLQKFANDPAVQEDFLKLLILSERS